MHPNYTPKDVVRFWSKVDKSGGNDACWLWIASCTQAGYGAFGVARKILHAHRIVWELTYGLISEGLWVCHHCDNPSCCNPKHLFLGTPHDNTQDMMRKGRHSTANRAKGERQGSAKLTRAQVDEMRRLHDEEGIRQVDLARMFGIKQPQVSSIIRREFWK